MLSLSVCLSVCLSLSLSLFLSVCLSVTTRYQGYPRNSWRQALIGLYIVSSGRSPSPDICIFQAVSHPPNQQISTNMRTSPGKNKQMLNKSITHPDI